MTEQKKEVNEKKIVNWCAPSQNLIKFEGCEDPIEITEKTANDYDFTNNPIKKGDTVEVLMKNNEVVFLKKGVSAKKEEPVKSQESDDIVVKTITITSMRKDRTALKESGGTWPKIAESIQGSESLKYGTTVEVKMQGDTIIAVKKSENNKTEQESTVDKLEKKSCDKCINQQVKTISKSTNTSIEIQVAAKETGAIIRSMIEKNDNFTKEQILDFIKIIMKSFYEAMQEV